ncbi:MAG: response regulator [Dehalococcoidia bacterium]
MSYLPKYSTDTFATGIPPAEDSQADVHGAPLVLVVEDDPGMNAFIGNALSGRYRVEAAFDGREGLRKALDLKPDLILSDVIMPGMGGDEMVRSIRRHRRLDDVPVVMLASKADDLLKGEASDRGTQEYIIRPFSPGDLLARVDRLLLGRTDSRTALERSESRFHVTFENAAVGMAHVGLDGCWLRVNQRLCDIVGYSKEELLQKRFSDITHPGDLAESLENANRLINGEIDEYMTEKRYVRGDGSTIWVSLAVSVMRDHYGRAEHFITVISDISRRREAEARLRELNETLEQQVAERTAIAEQRSDMLRRLAKQLTRVEQKERRQLAEALHDQLQQILVAAKLGLYPLRTIAPLEQQIAAVDRVNELVTQATEISRSLTFQLSPPILHDAGFTAALNWLAGQMKSHRLEVTVDLDPGAEPKDEQVASFLFQATRELLFNVLQHSGVGKAHVVTKRIYDEFIHVEVTDQGSGFTPSPHDMPADTGFGLFNIRERLDVLGGRLDLQSAPGSGARVVMLAPLDEIDDAGAEFGDAETFNEVEHTETEMASPTTQTRHLTVLIADDHTVLRQSLAAFLRRQEDLEIVGEAADGQQAVEMARTLRPDIILMDISMPGVNGIEATRVIVDEVPGSRIIGLSMHDSSDMEKAIRDAGAVAYVTKGESADKLISTIRGV